MACRIVLCGASSVGKTTTANDWLHKHPEYKHIEEVARDVMRRHSITREDMKASLETKDKTVFLQLQCHIIEEQNCRELRVEGPFISDRGPDPLVFAQHYVGEEAAKQLAQNPAAKACLQRYKECLVVVLCPLREPTDDGVRLIEDHSGQGNFTELLRNLLDRYQVPHIYIDVTVRSERLAILEQAVKKRELPYDAERLKYSPLQVPFLKPQRSLSRKSLSLRRLEITPDSVVTNLSYLAGGESNRMVDRYGESCLMLVDFHKKVPAELVIKMLRPGVWVNGEEYQFLGCSSSGLRKRTCYMLRGTKEDVETVWKECGDFEAIKSVSKRLKRIGQLFSAAMPTRVEIQDEDVIEIDDIETVGGNFTDGCGKIGTDLAKRIMKESKLQDEYFPSVFQIRYQGCKGVVIKDPSVAENKLFIRKSMKKFNPGSKPFQELWLCDQSRPYSYGHLNRQFIMLFSGLGIKDDVFLQLQKEHFAQLEGMMEEPEIAIQMLLWNNHVDLAGSVSRCPTKEEFKADVSLQNELSYLKSKLIEKVDKLNLLVVESRNVFGVCDPLNVLEYGQCFFRPTIRGKPRTISAFVTVAKNPCYLLGDVRVLRAVDVQGLEHLVDCIVFPTKGKRPHSTEIAGSDLDGDQYFVCWNKHLIVPNLREPYSYPSQEAPSTNKVTRGMMIDYFAQQNAQSSAMGKIDAHFKYWAEMKGVECRECIELGKRFSHSVDSAKTGVVEPIPPHLKPPSSIVGESKDSASSCTALCHLPVWKKMEQIAKEKKRELSEKLAKSNLATDTNPAVSEQFIWSLIHDEKTIMSEFELFCFVQRWCSSQLYSDEELVNKLQQFSEHINFGEFTVDQQVRAIDVGIPKEIVTNALNKSKLLSTDMLHQFSLNAPHCGWRFYFHSSSANFDWQHLLRAVTSQPESMVIFKFSDGMTAALHFLGQFQTGLNPITPGSIVAYFFSTLFGFSRRHVLGPQYRLDLSDELLQLDRGTKGTSFFYIKQGEILPGIISIDIRNTFKVDKTHPLITKKCFQCVEVFVKSDNHKPTYLDSYTPDQPDELYPEEVTTEENIEELPSEDENEEGTTEPVVLDPYVFDAAIVAIQQSAHKGDYSQFLLIIQTILSQQGNRLPQSSILYEALQSLLITMVIKHAHKLPTLAMLEALQSIVTTMHYHFTNQSPKSCLHLLVRLSQLQCYDLVDQMIPPLLSNLQVPQISEYLEIVTHWQQWYFLHCESAHHIANTIFSRLCESLGDETPAGERSSSNQVSDPLAQSVSDTSQENSLEELANSTDMKSAINYLHVQQYTSHFAHLLLCHFLNEVQETARKGLTMDDTLQMLRAYDYKNPHQDDQSKDEGQDTTWRVEFSGKHSISSKKFTLGSFVSISLMTQAHTSSHPAALGRIFKMSNHPACVVVDVLKPIPCCLKRSVKLNKGHWQLSLVGNVITFSRAMEALRSLLDSKKRSTELLPLLVHRDAFPPASTENASSLQPAVTALTPIQAASGGSIGQSERVNTMDFTTTDPDFNQSQQQAIAAALKQRLTLIHGPPGTGKTHVACEIVRHKLQGEEKSPVLVAAETNMAVDNLTRKLLQLGMRVVRIGNRSQISPDVHSASLDCQLDMKRIELGKARKGNPFPDLKMMKEILQAAEVVATTCAGAGESVLRGMVFPFVLIDEATQATEPISLVPATKHCQQLVLIGDPQQLAPTISSTHCTTPKDASSSRPQISNLSVTLFHRLQGVLPSFFLEEQHRMHPALAEFPSQHFYGGKLKSAGSVSKRPALEKVKWLKPNKPLVFIDVPGSHEKRVGTSFKNEAEAEMVVKIVTSLLSCEVSALEIAVLTPYSGQVRCIRDKLSTLVPNQLEVCTVDSFQGREKEVIVFSTVHVHSKPGGVSFTGDKYRMNVLLTRAKRGLVGIGSKDALQCEEIWAKWLKQVHVLTGDEFSTANMAHRGGKSGQQAARGSSSRSRTYRHERHSPDCGASGGSYHKGPRHQQDRALKYEPPRGQEYRGSRGQDFRGRQSRNYRTKSKDQDYRRQHH